MDCKATVQLGEFSRGGRTRGEVRACDHDLGCQAKYIPCGVVDEDSGQLSITFGSSAKTSDFIVDALEARWYALPAHEQHATARLQLKMDNGPESSGRRTQFLHRMVQFADQIGKPIQLLVRANDIINKILSEVRLTTSLTIPMILGYSKFEVGAEGVFHGPFHAFGLRELFPHPVSKFYLRVAKLSCRVTQEAAHKILNSEGRRRWRRNAGSRL